MGTNMRSIMLMRDFLGIYSADAAKLTAMIQVAAKSVAATTTTTTTTTTSDSTLPPDVKKRLDALVTQQPIVLFMKGTPDAPRCGFSSKALALLTKHGVAFGHVDVLADAEARASMKAYANWPTFPQFWVGGKLIGGLDVANELESEGELGPMLKAAVAMASNVPESLDDRLRKLIASSPVMLFMKGDRTQPRCGFSAQIVKILDEHKVEYATFDILQDQTVRDGLKKLSNWPTYPQLYSKGKLIGGLDVVKELVEEKELENALK